MIYNIQDDISESEDNKTAASLSEDEILSLFEELKQESKADDTFRDNGITVEQLSQNKTTQLVDQNNFSFFDSRNTIAMQELRSIVKTWSTLICKDRPSVYGVPLQDDDFSVAAAEIVTAYIEYFETEVDTADKWQTVTQWAGQHGTGIMKVIYNPDTNRVEWQPLSIYDVWIENAENPDEVNWCVIKSLINKHTAKKLVQSVNKEAGAPACEEYTDGAGIVRRDKVAKYEIWYKPGDYLEKGLYACIIGDTVVEAIDYPHVFKEVDGNTTKAMLPIAWFNALHTRAATLGQTFANDCAPIQSAINKLFNRMVMDGASSTRHMVVPKSILDQTDFDEDDKYISVSNPGDAEMIRWLQMPPVNQESIAVLDRLSEKIWEIAGLSKVSAGQAPSGSSARAIAYQAEIDANRHADAFKSFERANRYCWELTLKLIQKYYTEGQQFAITGKSPMIIRAADIAGVSVRLESRSERDSSAAQKRQTSQEMVGAGFAGPEALTASQPTLISASQRMLADDLITQALQGRDISPEQVAQHDPNILADQIERRMAEARIIMDIPTVQTLRALKEFVMRALSATAVTDPNANAAGPQQPGPLPESAEQEQLPPAIAGQ
jgi:hypothetical protein